MRNCSCSLELLKMAADEGPCRDDMAVLLQEAVAELQATRKQTETLLEKNQKLIDENSNLTDSVKEILACSREGKKREKPRIQVSVHAKVYTVVTSR